MKQVLITFFIYLKVVGDNCQLSPPFSTFLRVAICVLPRSHWGPEGESHRPAPSQGRVRVCLKQPFHLWALTPVYIQVDNQENQSQAGPATLLSAASTPANPAFASLVISCLLMAQPQLTAVAPLARGGPSTERLIVPVPGWAQVSLMRNSLVTGPPLTGSSQQHNSPRRQATLIRLSSHEGLCSTVLLLHLKLIQIHVPINIWKTTIYTHILLKIDVSNYGQSIALSDITKNKLFTVWPKVW